MVDLYYNTQWDIILNINNKTVSQLGKILKDNSVCRYASILRHYQNFKRKIFEEDKDSRKIKVVVSMTTIPSQINLVYLSIESILKQSYKPDKIILYLDKGLFKDIELPKKLLSQKKNGLEIIYYEGASPQVKYFYAAHEFSNSLIITVDDGIYYPTDLIYTLLQSYSKDQKEVKFFKGQEIIFDHKHAVHNNKHYKDISAVDHYQSTHKLWVVSKVDKKNNISQNS